MAETYKKPNPAPLHILSNQPGQAPVRVELADRAFSSDGSRFLGLYNMGGAVYYIQVKIGSVLYGAAETAEERNKILFAAIIKKQEYSGFKPIAEEEFIKQLLVKATFIFKEIAQIEDILYDLGRA